MNGQDSFKANMKSPDLVVPGCHFTAMFQPFVYHWLRGEESLYIGVSEFGWQRLLSKHKWVNRVNVMPDDKIMVYYCDTKAAALTLEAELIARHEPKYVCNKGGKLERKVDFRHSPFYR